MVLIVLKCQNTLLYYLCSCKYGKAVNYNDTVQNNIKTQKQNNKNIAGFFCWLQDSRLYF